MIQVENLSFNYVGTKREVFSDFSLQLTDNKIYGLLGKNGTGKSTLLYLLCGLLRPKKGGVFIDGVLASDRRSAMLEDIFMVPEEFTLPQVTLDTYVKMNKGFYPHFSEEVLERCLADFELSRQTKLHQLSMGQKKKAFMSFALATGTRLLLMDEPTNGLDIPLEKSVSQGYSQQYDRRPHHDHLHPSGARHRVVARPRADPQSEQSLAQCFGKRYQR